MTPLDRATPPQPGPVRPFHFPRVAREVLSNGLSVYSANHGSLPLATARVVLDAGAAREPGELAGVAQLMARTIDAGTSKRDAERLSWDLELLGAQFIALADWDCADLSVTAPADRMKAALEILAELVTDARFPESEVQRLRTEQLGEILQNRSEPRILASEMISRFIYGESATYGRSLIGDTDTVQRLTAADVRSFHRGRSAPGSAALILTGAVDDALLNAAREVFGSWDARSEKAVAPNLAADTKPATIHIVDRADSVQSEIRVGHPGITRLDPDYFPILIMNSLLGGAFTSRLNMNLRERQGWTYGVRSTFNVRRGPGPFTISAAVATEVTGPALHEIMGEVERLQRDGADDDEVRNMRDYLAGVLPLEVQTTQQLGAKLSDLFVYSLPDDYFEHYRDNIAAVTIDDVNRVARQYIKPDRFTVVVVGDAKQIEPALASLEIGRIEVHDPET